MAFEPEDFFAPWESVFREAERLYDEVTRFFEDAGFRRPRTRRTFPPVNIWSMGDQIVLSAELPGMKAEEIDISLNGRMLTIRGERKREPIEEDRFHRRERIFGNFHRSFQLPVEVDADSVQAEYINGVLTVWATKAPEEKTRRIEVKTS